MNKEVKEAEVKSIVCWLVGYVSVMKGYGRLKEEVKRLDELLDVSGGKDEN